jgi:hypothetical protein
MRLTILHLLLLVLAGAEAARAQTAAPNPFTAHTWHFESEAAAGFETWNYNGSHDDLFGLNETITYGMRDGLALRMGQRFAYVSQRSQDAVLLGLTIGLRRRIAGGGRVTGFLQGDVGVSSTAIATPPRGTRFNYLAVGGGGVLIRMRSRLHLVTTIVLTHLSNASLKGRSRNPDIEAVGPTLGVCVRF